MPVVVTLFVPSIYQSRRLLLAVALLGTLENRNRHSRHLNLLQHYALITRNFYNALLKLSSVW
jgi:hypothetical protein